MFSVIDLKRSFIVEKKGFAGTGKKLTFERLLFSYDHRYYCVCINALNVLILYVLIVPWLKKIQILQESCKNYYYPSLILKS